MEKYLYFTSTTGDINATNEVALYPTSALRAFETQSATQTNIYVAPRDGSGETEDTITLTHADGAHKSVMYSLVQLINADKNKSPFVVAADLKNGVFNIEGVTSVTITSVD